MYHFVTLKIENDIFLTQTILFNFFCVKKCYDSELLFLIRNDYIYNFLKTKDY